jgi:hypothetical protein
MHRAPPPHSFVRQARWISRVLAPAVAVVVVAGACSGSRAVAPVAPGAHGLIAGDLRFKGVGTTPALSAFRSENLFGRSGFTAAQSVGTPLSMGPGTCVEPEASNAGDCGWLFSVYALPDSVPAARITYFADFFADIQGAFDTLSTSAVVTGLDLHPDGNIYAMSVAQDTGVSGFGLAHHLVAPGQLAAAVAAEATQRRVVTAVSYDSGQVYYLSYGWTGDTVNAFETAVATAALGTSPTLVATAQHLADEGYIITAAGGDSANGVVLVGTRIKGVTTARTLMSATDSLAFFGPATTPAGFAVVGLFFNTSGGEATWLAEK